MRYKPQLQAWVSPCRRYVSQKEVTPGSHPGLFSKEKGFLRLEQFIVALLHKIKEGELNLNLVQSLAASWQKAGGKERRIVTL